MNGMAGAEDYYDVWLDLLGRISRPRFLELLLDRAGVRIGVELASCLVTVDLHGPIGVVELAERLNQNHPKASRSLARLEQLGLVERAEAADDRRIKTASVTAEGKQIVEAVNRGRRRLLEEAFDEWSERDRAELARLTRRFSDRMFALIESHAASQERPGPDSAGL